MDDSWNRSSPAPYFYLGRFPIHMTGLIILAHVAAMLVHAFTANAFQPRLGFMAGPTFEEGQIWGFVTHALRDTPSLGWAIGLWVFYYYGSKVEENVGRLNFGLLFLGWIAGPPIFLSLVYGVGRLAESSLGWGRDLGLLSWQNTQPGLCFSFTAMFTFLAFVRMFPNSSLFFLGFPAKWAGLVLVFLQVIMFVMMRSWLNLGIFLACMAITKMVLARLVWLPEMNLWEELNGGGKVLEFPRQPSKPSSSGHVKMQRASRDTEKRSASPPVKNASSLPYQAKLKYESAAATTTSDMATVDEILEKISKEGVASLTPSERLILQSASQKLVQRDHKDD